MTYIETERRSITQTDTETRRMELYTNCASQS